MSHEDFDRAALIIDELTKERDAARQRCDELHAALERLTTWSRDMWLAAHRGVVVKWEACERELSIAAKALEEDA